MISPTIGRVVLVQVGAEQALPALVCFVHSDRLINVGGFDGQGQPVAFRELSLLQDDDEPPVSGPYAEWMPYQKAVAASASSTAAPGYDPRADVDTLSGRVEQLHQELDALSEHVAGMTETVQTMATPPAPAAETPAPAPQAAPADAAQEAATSAT